MLTVLLAVEKSDSKGDSAEIEYPAGLPSGIVEISNLYWPQNWLDSSSGVTKIPVMGYRSAEFGVYDGQTFSVILNNRPQARA